jgi:hypothetical protein
MLAATGLACVCAANAQGAFYKMVLCAGNNGSNHFDTATNTTSPQNPGGIFSIENYCGPAPDPAGGNAFIRIVENQAAGNAGNSAYASVSWTTAPWVNIVAGGGWTRQPNNFNDGWRSRFWGEDWGGGTNNILMQGSGVSGGGIFWGTTSTFSPHLWPFGGWGNYRRFVYEMTCVRPAGCDRSGWNGTDANTFVLILDDVSPSQVGLTNTGAPFLGGQWVRGSQTVTYNWSDLGSGIRFERLMIDGAERWGIDHIAAGQCNRDASGSNGEFARGFQPCPVASNIGRGYTFNTDTLADGAHTVQVCTQDYAQWQGYAGTGGQSCDQRTIRTDNTAPGAPAQLVVNSANPERYLDRFGATFTLPPNQGSPIVKAHYSILDAAGKVVVPEKTVNATNPIALTNIEGKKEPGAYRLQVRLEDAVGFIGPPAVAPIPHDTTPPAAPQDLSVTSPTTSRSVQGFDVRWHNILDAGAPINGVHYRVVNPAGEVVVPATTLTAENPQAIENLDTPRERGGYTLELWLSDAEQNTGAPVKAPLTYDCVRSEVGGGSGLTAGLGERADGALLVRQGEGSTLRGKLQGLARSASAPVCVFSQVVTDSDRQFLGVAMTDPDGSYQFAIGAGPSRDVMAVYRPDQRELTARAALKTKVRPSFQLVRKVVRNKGFAIFEGAIPGPRSNEVVVVLQVKSGKAWRVFRRYRTREDGRFLMRYRFTQTATPTVYIMRAQVRAQSGYPYEEGNSQARRLRVVPADSRARRARP